jgi:hypothetical protein
MIFRLLPFTPEVSRELFPLVGGTDITSFLNNFLPIYHNFTQSLPNTLLGFFTITRDALFNDTPDLHVFQIETQYRSDIVDRFGTPSLSSSNRPPSEGRSRSRSRSPSRARSLSPSRSRTQHRSRYRSRSPFPRRSRSQ